MDSSVLKNDLDMASDKPLYEQLISFIKSDIDNGLLNVGDLLPSENEFCERYDISRPTVRQALSALEEQGLVVRMRGKGSFVTRPKVKRSLKTLYSFSDEVAAMGLTPKSRVIAYEVISPGEEIRSRLGLADGEKVYSITRVRYAGDEPIALEMAFIPTRMSPFLTQEKVETGSLYKTLAAQEGIEIGYAKETYETAMLSESEAQILGCKQGTCAFFIQRTAYTLTDEVFEYTVMIVRSDRCKYEVELTSDNVQLSTSVD
ncbi:MAG: GntR family transcriptional regulator [Clostridia bacterium]|jgi:GntR family transcriptional regulator|nr:GntR family transcriptional regulator [Clostridia bacterium]MBT7122330.1 GntR family transcriptional regulator [Clostridia bacterium]